EDQAVHSLPRSELVLCDQVVELERSTAGLPKALDDLQRCVEAAAAVDDRGSFARGALRTLDDDRPVGQPLYAPHDERRIVGKDLLSPGGQANDAAGRSRFRGLLEFLE